MRGNPRRDAIEYGVLLTLGGAMVTGLGLMIYVRKTTGLEKLDLNAPLDFKGAWKELKGMRERIITVDKGNNSRSGAQQMEEERK
jgi:hypothetical protein